LDLLSFPCLYHGQALWLPPCWRFGAFAVEKRDGRNNLVRSSSALLNIVKLASRLIIVIALAASSRSFAAEKPSDIPAWLRPNVGEGESQIAPVVLQRARALYFKKVHAGAIRNPCYFAMDATRPHDLNDGKVGARFYVICESARSFRAFSAGHGGVQPSLRPSV
jgi:hypothetical protein